MAEVKCAIACDFAPDEPKPSYVCTGSCGERVVFGVSQALVDADLGRACQSFRAQILKVFGPGGPRRFDPDRMPVATGRDVLFETGADGIRRRRRMPPQPVEQPNEGSGFEALLGLGRYPESHVEGNDALLEIVQEVGRAGKR